MLTQHPRRNIRFLHLDSVSLHLAELNQFVDQLGVPLEDADLHDMHPNSGTWADALDVLGRVSPSEINLRGAMGAEAEAMSDDEQ